MKKVLPIWKVVGDYLAILIVFIWAIVNIFVIKASFTYTISYFIHLSIFCIGALFYFASRVPYLNKITKFNTAFVFAVISDCLIIISIAILGFIRLKPEDVITFANGIFGYLFCIGFFLVKIYEKIRYFTFDDEVKIASQLISMQSNFQEEIYNIFAIDSQNRIFNIEEETK